MTELRHREKAVLEVCRSEASDLLHSSSRALVTRKEAGRVQPVLELISFVTKILEETNFSIRPQ